MHICVSKLTIICAETGLSPDQCQAVIWTIDGILLIWPLWENLSEKFIEIDIPSFLKYIWKWRQPHYVKFAAIFIMLYVVDVVVAVLFLFLLLWWWQPRCWLWWWLRGLYVASEAALTDVGNSTFAKSQETWILIFFFVSYFHHGKERWRMIWLCYDFNCSFGYIFKPFAFEECQMIWMHSIDALILYSSSSCIRIMHVYKCMNIFCVYIINSCLSICLSSGLTMMLSLHRSK